MGAKAKAAPDECCSLARMWMCQTFIWLMILTGVKLAVCILNWFCQDWFYAGLAEGFKFIKIQNNPHAQLITSVIVVPVIGDALQFAIQDTFLKRNDKVGVTYNKVAEGSTSGAAA